MHIPEAEMIAAGSVERLSAIESSTRVTRCRPENRGGASLSASLARLCDEYASGCNVNAFVAATAMGLSTNNAQTRSSMRVKDLLRPPDRKRRE